MCVTSLLCGPWGPWHGPIYGRFMGCTGRESARKPHRKGETHNLSKVSRFLFKSFYIRRLQKQLFFSHTNPYILNVTQQWGWDGDGHISSLGYMWFLYFSISRQQFAFQTEASIRHKIGEKYERFCFVLFFFSSS